MRCYPVITMHGANIVFHVKVNRLTTTKADKSQGNIVTHEQRKSEFRYIIV